MQNLSFPRLFQLILLTGLLALTAVSLNAQRDDPASIPPPSTVTIAGTLQTAVGCSGSWNTGCVESQLTYDEANDLWWATFELPAGNYEYKAALNGSWDDNYGLNAEYYGPNIPLAVPEAGPVTFWYDHKTRWVSDDVNSLLAHLVGDFQDELGCAEDWQADCLLAHLQDPQGDGLYQFITAAIPPGDYEVNLAFDFGATGGAGDPVAFTAPADEALIFTYDSATDALEISTGDPALAAAAAPAQTGTLPPPAVPVPNLVVVPGTIQSVLGCSGDWDPTCEVTALPFVEEDQLWGATFDLPAGSYEYKVALDGSWGVNFGQDAQRDGPNIPLVLEEETAVSFYFSNQTGWIADSVNELIASVYGDFQSELGCADDWQADCLRGWLQDPDGDGIFIYQTVSIPAGSYETRVAFNRSEEGSIGLEGSPDGDNIPFDVPNDGALMTFAFDSRSNSLRVAAGSGAGQGNINEPRAHWVAADTIAWNIPVEEGVQYFFHYDPLGGTFALGFDGFTGGQTVPLTVDPAGLSADLATKFPHLSSYTVLKFSPDDARVAAIALKGQVAVSAQTAEGELLNATGLQIPGVLDDLYTYDGPLGITWEGRHAHHPRLGAHRPAGALPPLP
jgi:pullulanase